MSDYVDEVEVRFAAAAAGDHNGGDGCDAELVTGRVGMLAEVVEVVVVVEVVAYFCYFSNSKWTPAVGWVRGGRDASDLFLVGHVRVQFDCGLSEMYLWTWLTVLKDVVAVGVAEVVAVALGNMYCDADEL